MNHTIKRFYQAGGSLSPDWPSYVEREADKELYKYIHRGEFCYILTARQMGKSSLKVRIMQQLAEEGWAIASVDLTAFGTTGFTAEQWYESFLAEVADALDMEDIFEEWWPSKSGITPVARMGAFWEEIVLKETSQDVVVFIDEVDTVLSLNKTILNTDDFFAAIRAIYNKRSLNADSQRLNFAVFGVAAPHELMSDHERTPFNIGVSIPIHNFTLEEASVLKKGFINDDATNSALLERILYWTSGQPYLSQELCQKLSTTKCDIEQAQRIVDEVVATTFFTLDILNTPHFSNINSRIVSNEIYNLRMLDCYRSILIEGEIMSNKRGYEQLYLKLAGIVQEASGKLTINNNIYKCVFDFEWLEKTYGGLQRPFSIDLQRWLASSRSIDALLKGSVLQQAEAWAAKREDLTNAERNFLQASRIAEYKAEQDHILFVERSRQRKRLQFALVIAIIAAIAATLAGIYGLRQASIAKSQAELAENLRQNAEARLEQFKQEQANRVSTEVDVIIDRALALREKGYKNTVKELLYKARGILNEKEYEENELLDSKREAIKKLLK